MLTEDASLGAWELSTTVGTGKAFGLSAAPLSDDETITMATSIADCSSADGIPPPPDAWVLPIGMSKVE